MRLLRQDTSDVALMETHISWVILAGAYAYKIKKPVNFGFLDFSTLENRRFFCAEELRLNRRLAPDIYLEVLPITGTPDAPVFGGIDTPIEYAVRMKRFDQGRLVSTMLAENRLEAKHIDNLAEELARFHASTPTAASNSPYGTPDAVLQHALENFGQITPLLQENDDLERLEHLRSWTAHEFELRQGDFSARKQAGFIRECHGDLHAGNMVLLDHRVVPFDCIEFNPNLRWVDVISEAAFVMMDLMERQQPGYAWRFLDRYLMLTGDYAGMAVLRFYLVYRAMVRAKVAALRAGQGGASETWREYAGYIALAQHLCQLGKPALAITHGLSGSGKTTLGRTIQEHLGALRLNSDVERKRLFGLGPLEKSGSGIGTGLYTPAASDLTYDRLGQLARTLLTAKFPVIVDATFIEKKRRDAFHRLAMKLHVPYCILDFQANPETLRMRIRQREGGERNPSEANITVLERQLKTHEPITEEEKPISIPIDTEKLPLDLDEIEDRIRSRLGLQG